MPASFYFFCSVVLAQTCQLERVPRTALAGLNGQVHAASGAPLARRSFRGVPPLW
jgi:hypothetical protein